MKANPRFYLLTGDELRVLSDLAHAVCKSKQNVGQFIRDRGEASVKFLARFNYGRNQHELTPKLRPGEVCLYCQSVGFEKKKHVAKKKAGCGFCSQPFTRKTPWRLLRGKRVHVACIPSHQ